MKRLGILLTLLLGLGLLAAPASAQFEDDGRYESDAGWLNQGWIGEEEDTFEDEGVFESEYGYESDNYGYYDRGYDWETEDGEYESWYGESDDWW